MAWPLILSAALCRSPLSLSIRFNAYKMGTEMSDLRGPSEQLGNREHVHCSVAPSSTLPPPSTSASHQFPLIPMQLWSTNGVQAHSPGSQSPGIGPNHTGAYLGVSHPDEQPSLPKSSLL